MFELLPLERRLFLGILILSAISSVLAHVQIVRNDIKCRTLLVMFASVQIMLGITLLSVRAICIAEFPITDAFDSMCILMVFTGITFLTLSVFIRQVWFLSVMAWVLFVITLLAAAVAKPALELQAAVRTPWVIVHALSMALSGAMIVFSAAMSALFLLSRERLKNGRFWALFGKMPTVEKLESLNLLGLRLCLAVMTLGLVSGVGLVAAKSAGLGMTFGDWLTDSKIVMVAAAWVVLLGTLILRRLLVFSSKAVAQATLVICFLIMFAFVGSKVFCKSEHNFGIKSTVQNGQMK